MPDVARADFRAAPELIPGPKHTPGFDIILWHFDTSSAVRFRSPLQIIPDGIKSRLLLQRSPPSLLTTAACSGLTPAPDCRRPRGSPSSLIQLHISHFGRCVRDTPSRCHLSPGSGRRRRITIWQSPTPFLSPQSNGFVGDDDTPLGQQEFNVSEAEAEHVIQPDRVADDLGGKSVTIVWIRGRLRVTLAVSDPTASPG